ncbi:hypothetical protein SESBI_07929 [Sesbania bispinosa]|nr:hypothetical protein SESBI_07929 [Sesbania bispinosa]
MLVGVSIVELFVPPIAYELWSGRFSRRVQDRCSQSLRRYKSLPLALLLLVMVLARAATKALAARNRWQRITVSDEPEDPDIPDLVPRVRRKSKPVDLWKMQQESVHQTALSMAGKAQEKLVEKLAKKQLKDAQKKGRQPEVSGSETSVADLITRKWPRVQIPVPPPQNKPEGHGPSKGSSSTTFQGDKGKASEERLKELEEQVKTLQDENEGLQHKVEESETLIARDC